MLIKMSSFYQIFILFYIIFFEIFKFKTGKCEITPKFVSRTQPVTVNFPVNRIYRPKLFSLVPAWCCVVLGLLCDSTTIYTSFLYSF